MLRQTFLHIPGVGEIHESALWKQGCTDWQHSLDAAKMFSFGPATVEDVRRTIDRSEKALEKGEHQYFARKLRLKEAWRAYEAFQGKTVYLDIETDGGHRGQSVTVVGMYDGKEFTCLQRGENLEQFRDIISNYSMIVTFFGSGFDLPMLQKRFLGLTFDQIHLDLCPTLRRVGYHGGLKKIEKQLGISRGDDTEGLNGRDAITLWNRFDRFGDTSSLEKLIAYNREDVVNLERLAQFTFQQMKAATYEAAISVPTS